MDVTGKHPVLSLGDMACDDVYHHKDVMGANVCQLLGCVVHVGGNLVGREDNGHSLMWAAWTIGPGIPSSCAHVRIPLRHQCVKIHDQW